MILVILACMKLITLRDSCSRILISLYEVHRFVSTAVYLKTLVVQLHKVQQSLVDVACQNYSNLHDRKHLCLLFLSPALDNMSIGSHRVDEKLGEAGVVESELSNVSDATELQNMGYKQGTIDLTSTLAIL